MKKHKCDTCVKSMPECDATDITWGIDLDKSAKGAEADKVIECDGYEEQK